MDNDDASFFLSEAIRCARKLPIGECLSFLRGLRSVMAPHHPSYKDIQSVIAQMSVSDSQLDLIQIGQLRLGVDSTSEARPVTPKHPGTETQTEGPEGKR